MKCKQGLIKRRVRALGTIKRSAIGFRNVFLYQFGFSAEKVRKELKKAAPAASQWILNSFLATIMSIISHDACSINNVAGKCSGGGISTGGALITRIF